MKRLAGLALAVTVLVGSAVQDASAAKLPVYRDPPSYKGRTKAPPFQVVEPPSPPPIVLSDTGQGLGPDVLVDEAGTAHIVWSEGRGDQDDAVAYCRLKRGATACDATAEMTWPKPYGTGDGPQYNIDYDGPRIVRIGSQLIAYSHRYPTVADKPGGASSSNTIAWTSSDGGGSWSGAQIVGTINLGQFAVIGGENDPTVLNSAIDPLCSAPGPSAWCLQMFRPGQFATTTNLGTRNNDNYYPGIGLDELGRPIGIVENLDGTTVIRRWTGSGDVGDAAQWTTSTIVADQPAMTGGPAGAFMMSKATYNGGPFDVRRLNVGADGVVTPGPPAVVSHDSSSFAELFQDPSGRLHAAWQGGPFEQEGVYVRSQLGAGFGPQRRLIDGQRNGQIELGAADDGGGFAVLNHTAGVVGAGQIVAVGFGNQASTGRNGLGDLPPGEAPITNVSCQKVGFGRFDIETSQGCLYHGTGAFSNLVVATGELTLNGLRIVPDAGTKIVIDPRKLQIDTTGPARVIASSAAAGDVVLFHGPLHADLRNAAPGSKLFEFPSQAFKANVMGFDVAANILVKLTAGDGVVIPVELELPPELGGFTGRADLIVNRSGLQVSSLKIHAGPIPLGALYINRIDIDWRSGGNWSGEAALTVPAGGTITARIAFADGEFAGATFNLPFPPPGAPIGPFVYLIQVNGGLGLRPMQIQAGATIGAGVVVAGESPIKVNGTFKMTFPSQGPASFQLSGTATIFFFDLANMLMEFQTDGYAAFKSDIGASLGPLEVGARADGWVDASSGKWGARVDGSIGICVEILPCVDAGADVGLSDFGFAACGEVLGATGGLKYPWSEFNPVVFLNPYTAALDLVDHFKRPCETRDYAKPPPRPFTASARAAANGGQTFTIKNGLPTATIVAIGDGTAPNITVKGPGGVTLQSGQAPSAAGSIVVPRGLPAAYVALNKPRGGDWTVIPNEGSADITEVRTGDGFTPARVTAKLRGRAIAYRITNGGHGQSVQFRERGRFGTHVLGTVSKSRGTLRFRPASGPGGKRTVYAVVLQDGFPGRERKVGTYTAPGPPKPGAVGKLRAKHRTNTVTVSWKRARNAARYVVKLRGSKGTRLARAVGAKSRGAKFARARRDERFTVTVRALAKSGRTGAVKTVKTR